MLMLAMPVILAELGWMAMGVVDTLMVGPLGPEAIGAVGVGSGLFMALAVFGTGVLLGLDTLVSHAFGARRLDECHRWLFHGVAFATAVSLPLLATCGLIASTIDAWRFDPRILPPTRAYFGVLLWSLPPLLFYTAFRRYLQALGRVRPVMFALVSANVINAVVNYLLIYGRAGLPAMGVRGAAAATVISRVYMAGFLLLAIVVGERRQSSGLFDAPVRLEWRRSWRLLKLGAPAAMQAVLEYGVFAAATALAGRFAPPQVAAHQIAMNIAAVSFMVPFGLASAGAVRVGHAIGARDVTAAARSGWTAILIGVTFMSCAALTFVTAGRHLIGAFTEDASVLAVGVRLLLVAALFQLFDGLQGVTTGVLRGLGDTRTAMRWNFIGHWIVGLPLGYFLAFNRTWGVIGLWIGLSAGLTTVGVVLLAVWARDIHALRRSPVPIG